MQSSYGLSFYQNITKPLFGIIIPFCYFIQLHYIMTSVHGARPFIYKGLHRALENVAEKFLNIYDTKIWKYKQKKLTLYTENEGKHAFSR